MNVRALVLTAGLGTRLRPLTYLRAKAAVPVNGQALAERAVRWLVASGVDDLVLNLHHHPASIAAIVGDGRTMGARVRYSWEQPVLGSAGGPRHALPLLTDGGRERFLLVNGDTLTDVDVPGLLDAHRDSGALVTMALIENPRPDKYGGVLVSAEGWVSGFTRAGAGIPSFHFIGVQAAEARVFADLRDGVPAESVNALYPALIAANPRAVRAFVSGASFRDIGTPADCLATSLELTQSEGERLRGARCRVDPSAHVARSTLWDDVTVRAGAELVDCIVGDGVEVPAGARFERCAIVPAASGPPVRGGRVEGKLLIEPL